MMEHKVLIVEKEVLERIDRLRGQESRRSFLQTCLDGFEGGNNAVREETLPIDLERFEPRAARQIRNDLEESIPSNLERLAPRPVAQERQPAPQSPAPRAPLADVPAPDLERPAIGSTVQERRPAPQSPDHFAPLADFPAPGLERLAHGSPVQERRPDSQSPARFVPSADVPEPGLERLSQEVSADLSMPVSSVPDSVNAPQNEPDRTIGRQPPSLITQRLVSSPSAFKARPTQKTTTDSTVRDRWSPVRRGDYNGPQPMVVTHIPDPVPADAIDGRELALNESGSGIAVASELDVDRGLRQGEQLVEDDFPDDLHHEADLGNGAQKAAANIQLDLSDYGSHLWVAAIVLFGFGDTLTSIMVFSNGGFESNPIMAMLIKMLGGSLMAFILLKIVGMFGLMLVSYRVQGKATWLMPLAVATVGLYLVFNNTLALIR